MQELKPGLVIGSYRVIRQLGAGGMGAVYEVEHVTLGVHYALKTFTLEKGEFRDPDDRGGGTTENIDNIHKRQDEAEKQKEAEKQSEAPKET